MTAAVTTVTHRLARRNIVWPMVLGISLGIAAFIPDLMPESAAPFATPVVSSGFAWGFTALLAGFQATQQRSAVRAGVIALALATITYYCLILFVSQRWYLSPLESEDGSESYSGLISVGRSVGFWLAGSVLGGAVMGSLGQAMRNGSMWLSSVASGLALGFLAGEGCYTLLHTTSIWIGPMDAFDLSKLLPSLTQILLTVVAMPLMLRFRKQAVSWPAFIATCIASVAANVILWHVLQSARMIL